MKTKLFVLFPALVFSWLFSSPLLLGQNIPLTTLYTFGTTGSTGTNIPGANPTAELVQGSNGDFYGTARFGGSSGCGTLFRISPSGAVFTVLYTFTGGADGENPLGGLVIDKDGNFYGTTQARGGSFGAGTVFKCTPAGVLTTLHSFTRSDGKGPVATLTLSEDGNFYGTTEQGGDHDNGTIFQISPAGVLTSLHSFSALDGDGQNADGVQIIAGLLEGSPGVFYGAAAQGGANGAGTLFKITSGGTFTTLHDFGAVTQTSGGEMTNRDGIYTSGKLAVGHDGSFYGAAEEGGSEDGGTIFKITPAGTFTVIHDFTTEEGGGTNGGLTLGADGNFYGTDFGMGGQIFQITPTGVLTTLHNFSGEGGVNGIFPEARPVFGKDGNLYGTTSSSASDDNGTIYLLGTGTPVIVSPPTAQGTLDANFTYQIVASGAPTRYAVDGLGGGMKVNRNTGLISGTPLGVGTHKLTLHAFNSQGEGKLTLTLTIDKAAPVITSQNQASAVVGEAFSFQITARNGPTQFHAVGLPDGIHIDADTGLISGTPTTAGTFFLTLKAINGKGTGTQQFTLIVGSN